MILLRCLNVRTAHVLMIVCNLNKSLVCLQSERRTSYWNIKQYIDVIVRMQFYHRLQYLRRNWKYNYFTDIKLFYRLWIPWMISKTFDFFVEEGPSCLWEYGSWIYNYICKQCLSPQRFDLESRSCKAYSIQHYMIKFFSDLRHAGGFLLAFRFPPTNKLTAMISWNIVESGVKRYNRNP